MLVLSVVATAMSANTYENLVGVRADRNQLPASLCAPLIALPVKSHRNPFVCFEFVLPAFLSTLATQHSAAAVPQHPPST